MAALAVSCRVIGMAMTSGRNMLSGGDPVASAWVRNRRLCFALALSIIFHADVVIVLDATLEAAPTGVKRTRREPLAVSLSFAMPAQPQAPTPPVAETANNNHIISPQPAVRETVSPAPARMATTEMPPVQPAWPEESAAPAAVSPAEPEYVKAGELSQRPRLLSLVEINVAERGAAEAPGRARLRVLINEQGAVDHVLVDESDLPADFERAAKDAFLNARYAPGEIDGVAVRSQIRIEVTYEGAPAQ
jgi:TonB family protein